MRLYTRTGATALDDPEYGHFDADEQGGFDLPDDLADRLHSFHVAGRPAWETDIERQNRLIAEELERRKDPATLLSVVEQLMQAATKATAPEPAPEPEAKQAVTEPAPESADGSTPVAEAPAKPTKRTSRRAAAE